MNAPDLNQPITFRGLDLNTVTTEMVNGKPAIVGCQVDSFEHGPVEVRQFTEPLALMNGVDIGGAWYGARTLAMAGTVYGSSPSDARSRIDAIDAAMTFDAGTFGHYSLSHSGGSIEARPNGLIYVLHRAVQGGSASDPLSIQWSVSFYCAAP